jgi:hypothetical protein
MRTTLFVLTLAISGISSNLQAARHHVHQSHQTHRVRKGETAARIAKAHGLSVAELSACNPKLDLKRLTVGMIVKVGEPQQPFRRLNLPAHPAGFPPANPVAPLPVAPALGPATLVHLERVLPIDVRMEPPVQGAGHDRSAVSSAAASSMAGLRPVLPGQVEPGGDEVVPPALTGPLGFEPADPRNLDLLWPVETRTVSSAWGPRMRSRTVKVKARKRRVHYRGSHKGVDLSAPKGADVFAALDGQVVAAGRHRQYGNFVVLDHGNGVVTLYAHHNRNFVKEGEIVRRGQKIAEVGRTGNATGPHLHFELRLEGLPQNPLPFLNDVEELPADLVTQNEAAVAPSPTR